MEKYLTVKTLAPYLDIKPSTLYSWVEKGLIPHYKINRCVRFRLDEIEEWLKGKKRECGNMDGSLSSHKKSTKNMDAIIRRAIDSMKGRRYTSPHRRGSQTCSGPERRFEWHFSKGVRSGG